MKHARIVVTGMGAYTPLATNYVDYKNRLNEGKSVIRNVEDLIPATYEIEPGVSVPILQTCGVQTGSLFYPEQLANENFGKGAKNRMSHATKIAFAAAREAVCDSEIFSNPANLDFVRERTGVAVGSGFGGISDIEKSVMESIRFNDKEWGEECEKTGRKRDREKKGLERVDDFIALKSLPGAAAAYISGYYELRNGNVAVSTECGSGVSNIIYGCKEIQLSLADSYICGGSGDAMSFLTFGGFDLIGALSKKGRSCPFDRDREGFVIGDGAGVVVIERLETALERGAKIYAEILGYGETSDGDYGTGTRKDAKYATKAIRDSLNMAGLNPCQIQHVNSHGTSTLLNDWQETRALKEVFGEHVRNITVAANKSMTGHMLNATAALELIATIGTINDGIVPPTINYENPDTNPNYHGEKVIGFFETCDLDYVPNKSREQKIHNAISTNFAFGGRNFSIVVGRYFNQGR